MGIYTSISANEAENIKVSACDEQHIRQYVSLLTLPVELRITNSPQGVISGYFTDREQLIAECEGLSGGLGVEAVYTTLNPVHPDLLARSNNRVKKRAKHTTSDADITRRVWLPIDCDAARPAGISATDEEREAAIDAVRQVRAYLTDEGFPDGLLGDSGNGGHGLYRVDEPNTPEVAETMRQFLERLAALFDPARVKLDTTVYNAARIWKVYGTKVQKGDEVGNRRHRLARILELPSQLEPVPLGLLQKVIGQDTKPATSLPNLKTPAPAGIDRDAFNRSRHLAERVIERGGLEVVKTKDDYRGGVLWVLDRCPFCDNADRTAHVAVQADGKLCFSCKHNRCRDRHWKDFRAKCDPGHEAARTDFTWIEEMVAQEAAGVVEATPDERKGRDEPFTELRFASQISRVCGDKMRWCPEIKSWLVWDGKRWDADERTAFNLVVGYLGRVRADIEKAVDPDRKKRLLARYLPFETNAKIEAILKICSRRLADSLDRYDGDGWLLNAANGVIDLRSGDLLPHDPARRLRKITSVVFDPDAKCPLWEKVLDRLLGGRADLVDYLHKLVGSFLVAGPAKALYFPHGPGDNGKSLVSNTLLEMLGDYGLVFRVESFASRRGDPGVPNDLARLPGVRLVVSTETEEGGRLDEAKIKMLTGGDKITARFLHKEFFDFWPTHKLWVQGNYKPVIRGSDNAIWNRVKLLPFSVTIPKAEQDPDLPAKLRQELPGILAWAVRGCLKWRAEGLPEPPCVVAATQEYRQEMDTLGLFLQERTIPKEGHRLPKTALYQQYVQWAGENNLEHPLNKIIFGRQLAERGFKDGTMGRMAWQDVAVKPEFIAAC
jgi:P4 family phage/plasmid primase-like protien